MVFKFLFVIVTSSVLFISCSKNQQSATDKRESVPSGKESPQTENVKLTSYEIKCEGLHCSGCEETITEKVKEIDGVKEINADSKTNIVKVTFDEKKAVVSSIEDAIKKAGYKVLSSKQI